MNSDMLAAGVELGDRFDFDLVHGHDWLVANACDHLARRFESAAGDDDPRHRVRPPPGLGQRPPAVLHPRGRALDHEPLAAGDHLLGLHARPGCRHLRRAGAADHGDPERDRSGRSAAAGRGGAGAAAGRVRGAGGAPRPADRPAGLREGLPARPGGDAEGDQSGPRHPLPGRRLGDPRGGAEEAGRRAGTDGARHLPRLDRRRRAAHPLRDRRPHRGALDLRALRPGRARGDGLRLPLHRRRHRRPARGRPPRGGAACASAPATRRRSPRSRSASSPIPTSRPA